MDNEDENKNLEKNVSGQSFPAILGVALFFNPFGFDAVQYSLILWTGSLWKANFILYCVAAVFFGFYLYLRKLSKKP
jgi:hypothetical protein